MKYFLPLLLFVNIFSFAQPVAKTENIILVTFDGYRRQEMFGGAQKKIFKTKKYTKDFAKLKTDYTKGNAAERREKLMPFMWGTVARQGQIYGNRKFGNKMNVTNPYKFSFPGYNEIFTGWGDWKIHSNNYGYDPNKNIFDFLQSQKGFENKIAAFATWDAFVKIINVQRNHVPVFADLKPNSDGTISVQGVNIDKWHTTVPPHNPFAKTDTITYHFAKEYMERYHPRFAFIGFDETDDFAHVGNYAAYLGTANTLDSYMEDLWNFIQSDPQYKDKTTLIITCDHGRGNRPKKQWQHHALVAGAQKIWFAIIGPGIAPKGEIKKKMHLRQNQIAATIAALFGYDYKEDHFTGKPMQPILQ